MKSVINTESIERFIDDRLHAPLVRVVDRLLDALPQRLDRRFAALVGGASLLTVLMVSAIAALLIRHADAERRAAIGQTLTSQLAALSEISAALGRSAEL